MTRLNRTHREPARALTLMCGASVAIVAALSAGPSGAQSAGAAAPGAEVSEIVVTGTSIRGEAPVGSSVTVLSQEAIQNTSAQTIQDVLKGVPSIVGLQSAGQGSFGSADASGTDAPTIHGLGASASNSTLVLIDGHRFPLTGINHQLGDPNLLPTLALQRVEVLPDGASSTYGSDAVAGVVNFITRKHFSGAEIDVQSGFGDNYNTQQVGAIVGGSWDSGSLMAAYEFSDKSALQAKNRSYTGANHVAQGGTNLASFNCNQPNIQPGGAGNIYTASSGYASSVSSASTNAMCDYTGYNDLLPSEQRNSLYVSVQQQFGENLTLTGDVDYSDRQDSQRTTRGTVTATIFGPSFGNAAQQNPFFVPINGNTTSEKIYWDADALLGPGARIQSSADDFFANGALEYKINSAWRFTLGGTYGVDTSRQQILGAICTSCAYLALNGTTNSGGSLTALSVPATGLIVTQLPLTAANALNPFAAGGGAAATTGAGTLSNLANSTNNYIAHSTIGDVTAKIDGDLFAVPAGEVKVAVGAEAINYTLTQDKTTPLGTGPATFGSSILDLNYRRQVESAYAEILVPLVSADMNVPLVRRLDFDVSGRYDHYSDFGNTSNPKFGVNWELVQGLKFRANYAQSFVAPALTSVGSGHGITGETGFGAYGLGPINVPIAAYPNVTSIPGVVCTATTCQIGVGTITGAQISGGNASLGPQLGKTWSFGVDYSPTQVTGLILSATFWHNGITGAITSPLPTYAVSAASLNSRLVLFPAGATPAQVAALQGVLPTTSSLGNVFFAYDYRQGNVLNLDVEGIDFSGDYTFDTAIGRFNLDASGDYKTKFQQQFGSGTPWFSVLNTTGFNTTFPSIQFTSRVGGSWNNGPVSAEVYWNHTGSYRNWSGTTVNPITHSATTGLPTGGGDSVGANDTIDAHVSYKFTQPGYLNGLELYGDVTNLFDKAPPFYNSQYGYDTFAASPIGRVTSVGLRKKF